MILIYEQFFGVTRDRRGKMNCPKHLRENTAPEFGNKVKQQEELKDIESLLVGRIDGGVMSLTAADSLCYVDGKRGGVRVSVAHATNDSCGGKAAGG